MHVILRRWLVISPVFVFLILSSWSTAIGAVTLQELENDPGLTPEKFAHYFAQFRFEFGADVQEPESFLARQAGDCDDYATLADRVLKSRGFTPRLIAVRMNKLVHVVCYIQENNSYLDYNCRARGTGMVAAGSSLEEIADRVAQDFHKSWTSVSEFTYGHGLKRLVATALPAGKAPKAPWLHLVSAQPASMAKAGN